MAKISDTLRQFRLVVVSPSDVQDFGDVVERVVGELNRAQFAHQGAVVTVWRWDVDTVPEVSSSSPQSALDQQMRFEDSQLVVGIFWTRIGTIGPDGKTGTEHEIDRALDLWREAGRPNVALYFCTQPATFKTEDDAAQLGSLLRLKAGLSSKQILFDVTDRSDFERKFRHHLLSGVANFLAGEEVGPGLARDETIVESVTRYCPPPDFFAKSMFDQEVDRAIQSGSHPFWWERRSETMWMGNLFAFWTSVPGIAAQFMEMSTTSPVDPRSYVGVPTDFEYREEFAGEQRAVFQHVMDVSSDRSTAKLYVAPIEFWVSRYVEVHWKEFLRSNPRCSIFGIAGFQPIPSILVAHCILMTVDGWVILTRRSASRYYYPRAWSASFEKQASLGPQPIARPSGERTMLDTIARGLSEEFGIVRSQILSAEVISVGRECALAPSGIVLNAAAICSVSVSLTLEQVWDTLSILNDAKNTGENDSWIGLQVDVPRRLGEIVSASRLGSIWTMSDLTRLPGVNMSIFGGSLEEAREGILLWHPTSAARLGLCAAVLSRAVYRS